MAKDVRGSEKDRLFDTMQHVGEYAIAACIALLSDNIGRTYVRDKLELPEIERKDFGNQIRPGIPFGKILWVAGNAVRHYDGEPFHPENEAVLEAFSIKARDEEVAFRLLEAAGVRTEADLTRELEAILDGMDLAARAAMFPPLQGL
jgi:hypothetical protein